MSRDFLCLADAGRDGLVSLLDAADRFKETRGQADAPKPLTGKSVACVFEKPSTRTRMSLEVAVTELGGHPLIVTSGTSQMGRGEPVKDTARVFSRYVQAITLRTFSQKTLEELAAHSEAPVLNALSDLGHPMQLLADLQTVRRVRGTLDGLKYAWVGDGNNMANSWIEAAGLLGLELSVACPEGYDPDPTFLKDAESRGGKVRVVRDPREAVENADVVSTDVFASMGQEDEQAARLKAFQGYCVTKELVAQANQDVVVLHCLPAHRGEEITDEVLEGPRSFVWDQAEARLHTAKAAIVWAMDANE